LPVVGDARGINMNQEFLRYPPPKERQDLQEKLAWIGHFLRFDQNGCLELWTWPLDDYDRGPISTQETFSSVEDAYARVFRDDGPEELKRRNEA
jgi:hypothetical protein